MKNQEKWDKIQEIAESKIAELEAKDFPNESRDDNQRKGSIRVYESVLKYIKNK